jgi:hypothetical protein
MTKSKSVTIAASDAATTLARFAAVEAAAERIHQEQVGAKLVRALLNGGKLHAVISDGSSTIEVHDGQVALSVTQPADAEDAEDA